MEKKELDIWGSAKESAWRILIFWPKPIAIAFCKTLLLIFAWIGIDLVISLFAYLYAAYVLRDKVTFSAYYGPHYDTGVKIVFGLVFLYLLLHEAAQKYRVMEIQAAKFTWEGISVKGKRFSKESKYEYGISVKNRKPFKLTGVWLDLIYLEIDKDVVIPGNDPSKPRPILSWIDKLETLNHETSIEANGIEKDFLLVDRIVHNNTDFEYRIPYYTRDERTNQFILTSQELERSSIIRGEVNLRGNVVNTQLGEENVHHFVIRTSNGKLQVEVHSGRLPN